MVYRTSTEPVEIDSTPSPFRADDGAVTRVYPIPGYKFGRKAAIHAFQQGRSMLYAMRLPDGVIKIGITRDLAQRRMQLKGEILGFMFGDLADESRIHNRLAPHVHHGREYYYATDDVLDVVNMMRATVNLDPLAA